MNCPKCKSADKIKKDILNGKQRYGCKSCGHHYTVMCKKTAKPDAMKQQILYLYLAGLGFRAIGRMLGVYPLQVIRSRVILRMSIAGYTCCQ